MKQAAYQESFIVAGDVELGQALSGRVADFLQAAAKASKELGGPAIAPWFVDAEAMRDFLGFYHSLKETRSGMRSLRGRIFGGPKSTKLDDGVLPQLISASDRCTVKLPVGSEAEVAASTNRITEECVKLLAAKQGAELSFFLWEDEQLPTCKISILIDSVSAVRIVGSVYFLRDAVDLSESEKVENWSGSFVTQLVKDGAISTLNNRAS